MNTTFTLRQVTTGIERFAEPASSIKIIVGYIVRRAAERLRVAEVEVHAADGVRKRTGHGGTLHGSTLHGGTGRGTGPYSGDDKTATVRGSELERGVPVPGADAGGGRTRETEMMMMMMRCRPSTVAIAVAVALMSAFRMHAAFAFACAFACACACAFAFAFAFAVRQGPDRRRAISVRGKR